MKRLLIIPLAIALAVGLSSCVTEIAYGVNGCDVYGSVNATDTSRFVYRARYSNCDDVYFTRKVCAIIIGSGPNDDSQVCSRTAKASADSTNTQDAYCYPSRSYTFQVRFTWAAPGGVGTVYTESEPIDCVSVAKAA